MTPSSISLSLTRVGLIAIPISAATSCRLSISNKVIYEIIMQKYKKYKKQCEKDQQTVKSFGNLYRKHLHDNMIDKNECEFFVTFLLGMLMKQKINLFY